MATVVKNIIPRKYAEASQVSQYTVPTQKRTVVDKFTATNVSAVNQQISVNLVASGGGAGSNNIVLKLKTIEPGQAYICPEVTGQSLDPGGFISTLASAANSIVISSTGREIDII